MIDWIHLSQVVYQAYAATAPDPSGATPFEHLSEEERSRWVAVAKAVCPFPCMRTVRRLNADKETPPCSPT